MHRQTEGMKRACRGWTPAFLLVMLLAAGAVGFAGQIQVGAHGGLSIPNIRGGNNEMSRGFTSRTGPYFGFFADFRLNSHFSLRAEVNYASQGGKRNGMQPITIDLPPELPLPPGIRLYADFHNETILDYIEVPLLAALTWGDKPRFFIDAGPYIGFLARGKTITNGSSPIYLDPSGPPLVPPVSFDAVTEIKEDVNDLNAGIAGGAGLAIPAGPGDIIVATHFSVGLANIQKDVERNGKNHTGAIVVTVGYAFTLREKI